MKKLFLILISLGLGTAHAADLKTVFNAAQKSDPTYQGAEATYKAAYATIGQARGVLLPNLTLTGNWTHADPDAKTDANWNGTGGPNGSQPTNALGYSLALSQPLFNWQAFAAYDQVKATVKQAAANYAAAEQNLITRVAGAYFAVLQAQEVLRYTEAQKAALARQLQVAKQRYEVGLDPVTSVYDAQSQYDSTSALYIANANNLANQKEALRQITGQLYPSYSHLKNDVPLLQPNPANIDDWTQRADQQNALLQAQRFAVLAAEKNIKVHSAENLPVLALNGSYSSTKTTQTNYHASQTISGPSYGVGLTLPIYAGGQISSGTEQAQYQYEAALDSLEFTHRQTMANTRTAYLSVVAEISQIQADEQAVKSAAAALASNEAGYKVGTQTIVDVLTAQSNLYKAQMQYATDRYSYVNNILALKQAAGTLNANDVDEINAWLTDEPFTTTQSTKMVIKTNTAVAPKNPVTVKKPVHHTKTQQHATKTVHKKPVTHKTSSVHKPVPKHPAHKPAVKPTTPTNNNQMESNTDWNS